MPALRAVAYYRKSNDDDGESVEQQQKWARDACTREGIDLAHEFADHAKKGHETATRTAFHEMLRYCQEQARKRTPIDTIVCWHHNRFSRADSQESAWFVWEFRKAGVNRLLTASRWYNFSRMEDRVLLNIEQDTSNHRYVIDLAQATTRGRIAAASDGRWCGGVIPLGYRAEREEVIVKGARRMRPKRFILGPESEIATVRFIFDRYANTSDGLLKLAQELTRRGILTPRGRTAWTTETVKRIIINPVYVGRLSWNRRTSGKFIGVLDGRPVDRDANHGKARHNSKAQWIERDDRHEAIIDLTTFERCQEKLAGRRGGKRKARGTFVLTRLLRCAHCGRAMVGRTEGNGRRVYFCGGYYNCGSGLYHYNAVAVDALADALLRKLRGIWGEGTSVDALMAEVERQDAEEAGEGGRKVESLRRRLRQREADLAEGIDRLRSIERSLLKGYQEGLKAIQVERDQVEAELRRAEATPTQAVDQRRQVEAAVDILRRLDAASTAGEPDLLRDVLSEAVDRIELWFSHDTHGKRVRCKFVQALVWVREDVGLLCTNVNNASAEV
jgi:site-specific DNA recombinase